MPFGRVSYPIFHSLAQSPNESNPLAEFFISTIRLSIPKLCIAGFFPTTCFYHSLFSSFLRTFIMLILNSCSFCCIHYISYGTSCSICYLPPPPQCKPLQFLLIFSFGIMFYFSWIDQQPWPSFFCGRKSESLAVVCAPTDKCREGGAAFQGGEPKVRGPVVMPTELYLSTGSP